MNFIEKTKAKAAEKICRIVLPEGTEERTIKAADIIAWQNVMLTWRDENGKGYSPTYLKTIHNQCSAIFNHAVRFY